MPSRFALSLAILGLLATNGMAQANHFPPEVEFLNGTVPDKVESCVKQNALGELKHLLCERCIDSLARAWYRVIRDPNSQIILLVLRNRQGDDRPDVVYSASGARVNSGQP